MRDNIKLISIPPDKYSEYRYDVIFNAYKWDPQVGDHNTISDHAALINRKTAGQLAEWAEQLSLETVSMEEALIKSPRLAKELGLPKKILKELHRLSGYDRENNIRLMRFDFHPADNDTGWALSEVNSDVPGGLAEASVLPVIAMKYIENCSLSINIADSVLKAFKNKTKPGGKIAFIHATSYSDDRQVMQCLGNHFEAGGYNVVFAGPDHIKWESGNAHCILKGSEGSVDGLIRFFPLEWLTGLPKNSGWQGYYDTVIPSCNHPVAILTQSKRLPIVWDRLGTSADTWKSLLPDTADPRHIKPENNDWIYKPALGRVGEGISIPGSIDEKELSKIKKQARKNSDNWAAQQMFKSRPLTDSSGRLYHMCTGVFTVDCKFAGIYGRISPFSRIDHRAKDIPVLISGEE